MSKILYYNFDMRGCFVLFVSLFFMMSQAYAFEVIYPAERKNVTTNDYAFIFGRASSAESLTINDKGVYVAPNGAFAHTVKLHDGENRVVLRTIYGLAIYKYYKTTPVKQEIPVEDFEPVKAYVNHDNTPLRETPLDAGLNRMSHLFGGTHIVINGSKGSFYRVYLSKDKTGWIAKKDVTLTDEGFYPAEFINMDSERFKNAMIQTISFSKKLPYTIEDGEKEIIFRVYNPELSDESVYNLNIPKPENYAYTIALDEGKYTFKVRKLTENLKDITVVIDAGHGGSEKGAVGCLGDEEKDINLKIALQTAELLRKHDVNVVLTRECDANISLEDRVNFSKENEADIFVSIHLNSIGDVPMDVHKTRGTSVYYYNQNSKKLAEIMQKEVTRFAGTRDSGIKTGSFAVIRPAEYPAVLVETAYMTNPHDTVLYRNDKWIKKAAKGIAEGVISYIKK